MTDPLEPFYRHDVTIRPYIRKDMQGRPVYGPTTTVRVLVNDRRQLVRGIDGQEVVSETTIAGPLAALRDVLPGSTITLPAAFHSRTATVLATSIGDMGGAMGFPEHVELSLT